MSTSPVMTQTNFTQLFGSGALPVLEELFRAELARHPSRRDQLMNMISHDRESYQSSERHDLPSFRTMSEGEEYTFERSKQGASKTLTVTKYGLGVSISEEMVEDSRFSEISMLISGLAESGRESQEVLAMNLFNNGFSSETTADAVAVFSTSHTLPSGGTLRNRASTDVDLDITSLTSAITDFDSVFVSDQGKIFKMMPKYLVVHSSNRLIAKELVGSNLKPDTADNNLNPVMDEGIAVVSSPHLADSDAWFLTAQPRDTGFRVIVRKPLETKADMSQGFKNDAILYKARFREAYGVIHPYGIWGTSGA